MKITYPYQYTEATVPPRCRKPRPVRFDATLQLTIRNVKPDEAPVAIVEHGKTWGANCTLRPYTRTYRAHKGKLYAPLRDHDGNWDPLTVPQTGDYRCGYLNRKARIADLRAWARRHLIIRGRVWEEVGEPRFVLMTFGLGRNQTGTALMTDNHYNPNISNECYFRIDDRDKAIAAAERVALARGDTKSVPIQPSTRFDVRRPEVLRLDPRRQHGRGDPFLNSLEKAVQAGRSPAESGLLVLATTLKAVSR